MSDIPNYKNEGPKNWTNCKVCEMPIRRFMGKERICYGCEHDISKLKIQVNLQQKGG